MLANERDGSGDREVVLKHQPSFSESSRVSIPMWDSSDPDRAPPPLPLNPSASSPLTKAAASANVTAAAEAFAAKARENIFAINSHSPSPTKSPEKSLIRGHHHKRMQSLQPGNSTVRDLSAYLENGKSPDKSPDRSPERSPERNSRTTLDVENRLPEKSPTRSGTPTSGARELSREARNPRTTRPPPKAILGEPSPQSATMLALQNAPASKEVDPSLANITNGSSATIRTPQTFDAISAQILGLTSIATNLQREMAQLSRRSKDNATDLISLKEATNTRDEDIRKSLRELVSNINTKLPERRDLDPASRQTQRGAGPFFLDDKPYQTPPGAKSFSLPRIPSPASFSPSIDRELVGTPNPYSMDGAANLALLEKILRDMGTKEGQERLLSTLIDLGHKSSEAESSAITTKLEKILGLLQDRNDSLALVRSNGIVGNSQPPQLNLEFDRPNMPVARGSRNVESYPHGQQGALSESHKPAPSAKAADIVNDDMVKLLKRLKDSVTESGGMSAEIKALVRELRGEVLGMGREIGRKLDHAESTKKATGTETQPLGRAEVAHIVQQGLAELKQHMDDIMQEFRSQSSAVQVTRGAVDTQEVAQVVRNALQVLPRPEIPAPELRAGIEREDILEAVREAWETYQPEIAVSTVGLERDEVLQCLQEGLREYAPQETSRGMGSVKYEDVLDAVREALQDFKPPAPPISEAMITREEIVMTVRECLESFDFPSSSNRARETDVSRAEVLDAVREGLSLRESAPKELEISRDDLFDAIKAGLEESPLPPAFGSQDLDKMTNLLDEMRGEFQQYSAANGRDTEQVLDALKDGLEVLRAGIETYVDRAADVTGKDEIIETIRGGLDNLKLDLEVSLASGPRGVGDMNSSDLLDAMEKEFEHLRQTISTSMARAGGPSSDKEEIFDAIRDGFDDLRGHTSTGSESSNMVLIKEELEHLRGTLATTLIRGGSTADKDEILDSIREGFESIRAGHERGLERPESILSNTSELLDAFNEGLDSLKTDMERLINKPTDMTVNYEILDTLKEGLQSVRADLDLLRGMQTEQDSVGSRRGGEVVVADGEPRNLGKTDIENLEVMIAQLKIKVEALDNMPPVSEAGTIPRADFERLEAMMKQTQTMVAALADRSPSAESPAMKEDTDAIETLLRNAKAAIDEMAVPGPESAARTEHVASLESMVKEMRDSLEELAARSENEAASKTDIGILEALLKEVRAGIEDMRDDDGTEKIGKIDIEALETLCMDTKAQISEMILPDVETLPTKSDISELRNAVQDFSKRFDDEAELTAQAFESRKIEHGGLADKVDDVKAALYHVQEKFMTTAERGEKGIRELSDSLAIVSRAVVDDNASAVVRDLSEVVNREFERLHGSHEETRAETEQYRTAVFDKHEEHKTAIVGEVTGKLDGRFDELMEKYDEAQNAALAAAAGLKDKDEQRAQAMNNTVAVAEELKVLVDALGSSVSDSCDRMSEDSKTIFNKVEDMSTRIDGALTTMAADGKGEHELTRADISRAIVAAEGLQARADEFHPQIMQAITEVLNIISRNFEQAQRSSEEIKLSVANLPAAIPMPAIAASPTPLPRDLGETEPYDDTAVHAKLDDLVEHAAEIRANVQHTHLLEEIKADMAAQASEFRAFMATQQLANADASSTRARDAEEAATALAKRVAQKEVVEADVVQLSEQKTILETEVSTLTAEATKLSAHKSKLMADLSGLETAIQIRREEMRYMEARAETLERRILEGVLNHSRSLLIHPPARANMPSTSLKRVSSTSSTASTATLPANPPPSLTGSAIQSGIGMALKRRPPPRTLAHQQLAAKDRRILSLSTIGANKPTVERSIIHDALSSHGGLPSGGLKRSHSVKSNFPPRKTSWSGTREIGRTADELVDENKENSMLEEDSSGSETGTERRTSYGTETETDDRTSYLGSYTGTGSQYSGHQNHYTASYAGSQYATTDSQVSQSTSASGTRRSSYANSTTGTLGLRDAEAADEELSVVSEKNEGAEHDVEPGDQDIMLFEEPRAAFADSERAMELIHYAPQSDSGIGTDMPTATLDGAIEYFRDR